jgi:(E)-4-hydroxy-3-methylbut-2-enyl-diphosphate synthase
MIAFEEISDNVKTHNSLNFITINIDNLKPELIPSLSSLRDSVLVISTNNTHGMPALRRFFFELISQGIKRPVVIWRQYETMSTSDFQLFSATDLGGLLVDGLGDGTILSVPQDTPASAFQSLAKIYNATAFGILQAARTRMSKTEYISCPSCGRTLFDLQETTSMIRKRTDHLKGVKIGIMGCIVNGYEMADADYGYVGIGKDKIALYRGQQVVKKSVHADRAVDELIELIKEDGVWFEPVQNPELADIL